MKYTYCEKAIWMVMASAGFRKMAQLRGAEFDLKEFRRKTKRTYREILDRTPETGGLMKNPLRTCLAAGALWLSYYEAAEGRMSDDEFGEIVKSSMESPVVQKAFRGKNMFTRESQEKRKGTFVAMNEKAEKNDFCWGGDVLFGRDTDEFTILYRQCGICALGRQENLLRLVPYMCILDELSISWAGGVLYRDHTLAKGDDCCDFHICRKGSKWDLEMQKQQNR